MWRALGIRLITVVSLSAATGCGDDETAAAPPCSQIDGVGVQLEPVCGEDSCAAGVACASLIEVSSPDGLGGALAGAGPGSCVVLAPGSYGPVDLPGGASLLGKGAGYVHVGRVTIRQGSGSRVRGIDVRGGLAVESGTADAALEAACVSAPSGNGVEVGAGAELRVSRSHIRDAPAYGLHAFDAASLRLERTLVTGAGAPGLWAECSEGCACAAPPAVELDQVIVRDAALVGVALHGVVAKVAGLEVSDTRLRDFKGGGGLSLAACTQIEADDVSVKVAGESDLEAYGAFGILADSVSGRIGGMGSRGIIIVGGRPGVWVMDSQAAASGLHLEGFEIRDSTGVGLGVSTDALGIIIVGGLVANTGGDTVALAEGGAGYVGDGLSWQQGAQLTIDGLELSSSARQSVLIDGAVAEGSSISNLLLSGGDEASGVLQQGVSEDDAAPSVEGGLEIARDALRPLEVPAAPKPPLAI